MYFAIGCAILYFMMHGFILHFTAGAYSTRTAYEKFVTISSGMTGVMLLLAQM